MKLAASCIAWAPEQMDEACAILQSHGFTGLEIAPTMVLGEEPYTDTAGAKAFAGEVKEKYGLSVCSLQSIWFGQSGSIFGGERDGLYAYTKQAVLFAEAVGAGNLVFGCPKNRVRPEDETDKAAVSFFKGIGDFAAEHGTVLALEANPEVYGTNFMNRTKDVFAMAERVNSPGCKVNLDLGTMAINNESAGELRDKVGWINHVHVSEPMLAAIMPQPLHKQAAAWLAAGGYGGWVSIEMKQQPLAELEKACAYVAEVFA